MKNASWMMGLFAIAMMVLVACGVEQETPSAPNEVNAVNAQEERGQTEAPLSDVRISALTGEMDTLATCSPVGSSRACCPFALGCSCLGIQDCLPNGMWSRCLGAGQAGQPCP
jgi:hypothetical protein